MNLVAGPKEAPFPLNVGLLFFNPEPHRLFPATQIDVVWFPEGAGGDKFTEKTFRGPIHRMLREALDFIQRNYLTETVLKHPDRAEATRVVNFPYAAIEEALANAIYHRSYEEREPVEVRLSAEELVVLSYPGPDRSVRLAQLRAGRSLPRRYRNRRVGEFLKELEITEGRSTGIPKILEAMKRNGSPPPEFEFDEDHSYFMTRLPVQPQSRAGGGKRSVTEEVGAKSAPSRHQGTDEVPRPESPTQSATQSSDPVKRLLLALLRGEQPARGLREVLCVKQRPTFRKNYLHPALKSGFIEPTIADKPNSRLQRYRLTEKGRACAACAFPSGLRRRVSCPLTKSPFPTARISIKPGHSPASAGTSRARLWWPRAQAQAKPNVSFSRYWMPAPRAWANWAFEAMFMLAAGCSVEEARTKLGIARQTAVDTNNFAAAVERDSTKRHFVVSTDSAEMEKLLAAP